MRAEREADILRACLTWLHLQGVYCWRQNQGAIAAVSQGKRRFFRFSGISGVSDILGLLRPSGRLLAIEVKRPGCQPTPEQQIFLEVIQANGGLALCVHSLDELRCALPGGQPVEGLSAARDAQR
jgi:VRR-NUC domain